MPDEGKAPVLHCPTCYSTNFQSSRVRPEDRMQVWLLKQPVRCRKCNARVYASRSYAKWLRREETREAVKPPVGRSSVASGLDSSEAAE